MVQIILESVFPLCKRDLNKKTQKEKYASPLQLSVPLKKIQNRNINDFVKQIMRNFEIIPDANNNGKTIQVH